MFGEAVLTGRIVGEEEVEQVRGSVGFETQRFESSDATSIQSSAFEVLETEVECGVLKVGTTTVGATTVEVTTEWADGAESAEE